jgi:general secretion pathway protein G
MLVVILIIALLTGIVGPRLLGQVAKSEVTTARAQMSSIEKALQAYRLDNGSFPTTTQGLAALRVSPPDTPRWQGPYLANEVPMDPWGTPYQYASPGQNGKDFDLTSFGRDRVAGGDGADVIW